MIGHDPDLLSIEQAAEELGNVHVRTVYRLIQRGELASIRHARRTFIHRDSIRDYFLRLRAEGNRRAVLAKKMSKA